MPAIADTLLGHRSIFVPLIGVSALLLAYGDCFARPAADAPRLEQLEQAYLACDRAASSRRLSVQETQACSSIAERLLNEAFGGDLDRLLAWWRTRRIEPHAATAWTRFD